MPQRTTVSSRKRQIGTTWGSVSGFQPFKDQGSVQYESMIERDFIIRAEHDPRVLSIEAQPFTIKYESKDGFLRTYTPDFKVRFKSTTTYRRKSEIFEVKPKKKLDTKFEQFKPKFAAAINYCKYEGLIFKVIHENKIRDQLWENSKKIGRYRGIEYSGEERSRVLSALAKLRVSNVDELSKHCFSNDRQVWARCFVFSLIHRGQIEYDYRTPVSRQTRIWMPT